MCIKIQKTIQNSKQTGLESPLSKNKQNTKQGRNIKKLQEKKDNVRY